jgi:hypothetical protein
MAAGVPHGVERNFCLCPGRGWEVS